TFRFVNDGHGPPFSGTYAVIERPSRLVFEAMGSVGTVSLETVGNGTRMSVTIRCASKEQLEHFVELGVAANTGHTLDNLVRYVGASHTPA
ncbi:MAG: SRPBCC domain-containing protein, partial [Polyangiaceae bacterium]